MSNMDEPFEMACPEYAYVDPKNSHYGVGSLPQKYHPLDAWKTLGKTEPIIGDWIHYPLGGAFVAVIAHMYNLMHKPLFSQVHKTVGFAAMGAGISYMTWWFGQRYMRRRDANIQHYMETHYDDFPMIERKKFKDEFRPWAPMRGYV